MGPVASFTAYKDDTCVFLPHANTSLHVTFPDVEQFWGYGCDAAQSVESNTISAGVCEVVDNSEGYDGVPTLHEKFVLLAGGGPTAAPTTLKPTGSLT